MSVVNVNDFAEALASAMQSFFKPQPLKETDKLAVKPVGPDEPSSLGVAQSPPLPKIKVTVCDEVEPVTKPEKPEEPGKDDLPAQDGVATMSVTGGLDWTIKFKHAKTTVMLNINPMIPFYDVKALLLSVLRSTSRDGLTFYGQAIPDDPDEVIFARAIDQTDLTQGWTLLVVPGADRKGRNVLDCADGVGLKSADALAFKFGGPGEIEEDGSDWGVILPKYDLGPGLEEAVTSD